MYDDRTYIPPSFLNIPSLLTQKDSLSRLYDVIIVHLDSRMSEKGRTEASHHNRDQANQTRL